jgi:hypothetical protein
LGEEVPPGGGGGAGALEEGRGGSLLVLEKEMREREIRGLDYTA